MDRQHLKERARESKEAERERERGETENKTEEKLILFSTKLVTHLTESFLCQHHGEVR